MPMTERCEIAIAYLASHHVMTIATVGDDGPAAAAVFYAVTGVDLVFLSSPTTQHARNLTSSPGVAITVQDQETEWQRIQGLQLKGVAELLDGEDECRARAAFLDRFPGIFGATARNEDVDRALARIRWFRVRLTRLRFIDNSRGLGGSDEWSRDELVDCLGS